MGLESGVRDGGCKRRRGKSLSEGTGRVLFRGWQEEQPQAWSGIKCKRKNPGLGSNGLCWEGDARASLAGVPEPLLMPLPEPQGPSCTHAGSRGNVTIEGS